MTILRDYHEELEYDLLTLPAPVDLLDLYRGKLTPRRLWVIIRGLPMSSRLKQAHDPEASWEAQWTPTTYLIAEGLDLGHGVHKGKRLALPHPRPGDAAKKRTEQAEALQRLLDMQERNAQREISTDSGT